VNPANKPATVHEYVERKGVGCPYCSCGDVVGAHVEIEAGRASQEVTCTGCARSWVDLYALTGYLPLEE